MPQIPIEALAPYQVSLPAEAQARRATRESDVERLMAAFAAHEVRERESLRDYRESADTLANPLVKFLLQLIVSDEEKHHDIIRRLLASLQSDLVWDSRATTRMPRLGALSETERKDLLRVVDALIAEEKQGIADYKALVKSSDGYYEGLMELLVDTVILDSKKHLAILRFLKRRLRAAD
jgi:rubrerythrin